MLLVRLVRYILNALRHPDCKGQPMTKAEAEILVANAAAKHPDAAELDTTRSVVDVMKALNLDSGYPARKRLAQEFYVSNYTGTAEENLFLRDKLLEKVAADDVDSLRD